MWNSISHQKNDFERFVRTTRPSLYSLVLKKKCTREITLLTGISSHEELNRLGTF